MSLPYEILIRGKAGAYAGAHVIENPGDPARAVHPEDWPALASDINTAALLRVSELETGLATTTAENAALKQTIADATAAYQAQDHDAIASMITEAAKDERTKAREAAQAEVAAAQAKLDALSP